MPIEARPSSPPQSSSLSREERASYVFLVIVSGISLAADLASKGWAKARLAGFDPQKMSPKRVEVWKDHFDFIYALNPGGAWSFLRGLPDSLRRPFFLFVSASAIVFIVSIYQRVPKDHKAMRWGLPLALGGAMGNLVDRIRYGSVIDFIDVYITRGGREIHWPTFNVADIAIVVGVGLMVIDMMVPSRGAQSGKAAATAAAAGSATAMAAPTEDGTAALLLDPAAIPRTSEGFDAAAVGAIPEMGTAEAVASRDSSRERQGERAEEASSPSEPSEVPVLDIEALDVDLASPSGATRNKEADEADDGDERFVKTIARPSGLAPDEADDGDEAFLKTIARPPS